jgi:hypothetical protein
VVITQKLLLTNHLNISNFLNVEIQLKLCKVVEIAQYSTLSQTLQLSNKPCDSVKNPVPESKIRHCVTSLATLPQILLLYHKH